MVQAGPKAAGLAALPEGWTPDFLSLKSDEVEALAVGDPTPEALTTRLRASRHRERLEHLLQVSQDGVIVRSSAVTEEILTRGLFRSYQTGFPTLLTLAEALGRVWRHAAIVTGLWEPIPVVIQKFIPPRLWGHLSNERRLRPDRRDWTIEMHGAETATSRGIRAQRTAYSHLAQISPDCTTQGDLIDVLRKVAGALTEQQHRVHVEWVWSGDRLWLVQLDRLAELRSGVPCAVGWAREFPALNCFAVPASSDRSYAKVRCINEYVEAGLPHQDIRLLSDAALYSQLMQGSSPAELGEDLDALARCRGVLRTDVRRDRQDFDVLRARTDAGYSRQELLEFMRDTLQEYVESGIPLTDIAFLAHPFVPADASAWSLAAPGSSQVRVDATYGLPDGLLYYPHDSYITSVRTGLVRSRLDCKSQILVSDASGDWSTASLGAPWDWRPSLRESEVQRIAQMSKRLADHLGKPVETMFFVRAHVQEPAEDILPWVHRTGAHQAESPPATASFFTSRGITVRNRADLARLKAMMSEAQGAGERFLVHLRPEAEVLHDATFLDAIADSCAAEHSVIALEGSTLSHIYYELVRRGLSVQARPGVPNDSGSESVTFGKLVRDRIPANIAARGERVVTYRATGEELKELLMQKLIEEAFEVAQTESNAALFEEIGDVLDVLAAICAVCGTDLSTVGDWADQKRQQRGGFNQGLVLVETTEPTIEEAASAETRTFPVTAETRQEVDRQARAVAGSVILDEVEVMKVPYRPGSGFEIAVDGRRVTVEFGSDGLVLRRQAASDDPRQLSLDI